MFSIGAVGGGAVSVSVRGYMRCRRSQVDSSGKGAAGTADGSVYPAESLPRDRAVPKLH